MTLQLDEADIERLTTAFVLGTGRTPLPEGVSRLNVRTGDPALAALALAAQHRRFRRPTPPSGRPPLSIPDDPRPVLPQAGRAILLRLLSGRDADVDDAAATAALDALAARGWRVHPFDWPHLTRFLLAHRARVGPAEDAWLARVRPNDRSVRPMEGIDETNWAEFPLAARLAFVRDLRGRDAERGRQLVTQALPGEPAATRVALVNALLPHLDPADRGLLESLLQDRAPSVRDTAATLLARLPGTEAHAALVKDFVSRLTVRRAGILSRRTVLVLAFPANLSEPDKQTEWAAREIRTIGLVPLAAALGMSEPDMISAAEDMVLKSALFMAAAAERRVDAMIALAAHMEDAEAVLLAHATDAIADLPAADQQRLLAALFRPATWKQIPGWTVLTQLRAALHGPLPPDLAVALLASKSWRGLVESLGEETRGALPSPVLTPVATLLPAAQRNTFRQQLKNSPPGVAARALLTLDALDLIESAPNPPTTST
jgi:hypothetical protein